VAREKKTFDNVEISMTNIGEVLSLHQGSHICPVPGDMFGDRNKRQWPLSDNYEKDYQKFLNRVAPVVLDARFFAETSFKGFRLFIELSNFWDPETEVKLQKHSSKCCHLSMGWYRCWC